MKQLVGLVKVIKNCIIVLTTFFCIKTLQLKETVTISSYKIKKELSMKIENKENMKKTEITNEINIITTNKTINRKTITLKH